MLSNKLGGKLSGFNPDVSRLLNQVIGASNPQQRGTLGQAVSMPWFQDPLLKAIRYLENIDYKDQTQKVQFLGGLVKVIDKFDKKMKIEKIIPLLMSSMQRDPQLSVHVLPIVISQLEAKGAITSSQFRDKVWPYIIGLCKQKELPAQSLFILLKGKELIVNYVSQKEFGEVFLPLLCKSLECGIPKLQILALSRIKTIFTQMEYQTVKSQVLPRVCKILEQATNLELKLEVIDTLKQILNAIDALYLKTEIMKYLEKLRQKESDPKVCLKMLELYEDIGKILGPEEVGQKILPGIIPMLISGQFTKGEFQSLLSSVRRLLEQIEKYRLPTLPEHKAQDPVQFSQASNDPFANDSKKYEADPLAFLNNEAPSSQVAGASQRPNTS